MKIPKHVQEVRSRLRKNKNELECVDPHTRGLHAPYFRIRLQCLLYLFFILFWAPLSTCDVMGRRLILLLQDLWSVAGALRRRAV